MNLAVIPVQVRLLAGEQVQVPLAIINLSPGRFTEGGNPVAGRLRTVWPFPFTEDVALTFFRPATSGKSFLEPHVQVRGVVWDDIYNNLDSAVVKSFDHCVKVLKGPKTGVDVAVVGNVVPAVRERRRIKRTEPDSVDTQVL